VRGIPRPVAALLAAVLAAVALAACGGSGSSTSGSSSTEAPTATGKGAAAKGGEGRHPKEANTGKSRQPEGSSGSSGSSGSAKAAAPLKVSGGGSSQFRSKSGDNSIQNYGEESDESELRRAAEALHGFYVARADEDWASACSYLAKPTVKQLEELASRSPQLKGEVCAAVLHGLTRPLPASVEREMTLVDAASLRREGERAFLLYRGAGQQVYVIPMQQEGDAWKVGGLAATPLT
jgi:hypothetical protein